MKILTTHRPGGAWAYITDGWLNAFKAANIQCARWDGKPESWNAFDPDLYIGCSGHRQPIPTKRRAKVAIHVNPYGSTGIPGIDESKDAIAWTKTQRPDAVFGYGHASDISYWDKWVKELCPWVPMPTAGDSTIFGLRGPGQDIDVGYVGGRWPYKAKNIDVYLLPVFRTVKSVVYGWGGWPAGVSQGPIDEPKVPEFLSRCKICPCIAEPHTTQYGIDVPERVFKVILSGALAIHDPVRGLERYIPSIQMAKDPMDFLSLIGKWLAASEVERQEVAFRQRQEVLNAHTYFHRLAGLLQQVGFKPEADKMLYTADCFRTMCATGWDRAFPTDNR